jgi:flavin reductase (DIM6/NTAB) family NADH-FMN oxidoreductase RutF
VSANLQKGDTIKRKTGWGRNAIKRLVLGPRVFPDQCTLGLSDPQSEIRVWLHGVGPPRDVTSRHVVAAGQPLVIGIGMDKADVQSMAMLSQAALVFREDNAGQRELGRIGLKWTDSVSLETAQLHLFRVGRCENYCLPKGRLWLRYLYSDFQHWRSARGPAASKIRVSHRELHCLFTFYICPRPVVLVSVMDNGIGNIFPMDLIGSVADDHFSLALHATSRPVSLLENSRKIALSNVPVEQTHWAFELGKNHNKSSVDCSQIGFAITTSPSFGLPVPQFSARVREMKIESVRTLGSHKLFLARTIADHRWSNDLQLHFIHGFYQAWRQQVPVAARSVEAAWKVET